MEAKRVWNLLTFNELFKISPKQAFEYRKETLWDEIPKEYQEKEEEIEIPKEYQEPVDEPIIIENSIEPVDEVPVEKVMTRNEIKVKLIELWIDFKWNAKTSYLLDLLN